MLYKDFFLFQRWKREKLTSCVISVVSQVSSIYISGFLQAIHTGAEFRTRGYFLRHHRAHIDAESCAVPMPEDSWKGMVNSESSTEEGESVLGAPEPEKEKQMKWKPGMWLKKKMELRYEHKYNHKYHIIYV